MNIFKQIKYFDVKMISEYLVFKKSGKIFPSWARLKKNGETNKCLGKDKTVVWDVEEEKAVSDHIEISGNKVSAIISYGKSKSGKLKLFRHVTFPGLRLKPNLTRSSFIRNFKPGIKLFLEDTEIKGEEPFKFSLRGSLVCESSFMGGGATVVRSFYPSVNYPALIEKIEVTNNTKDKSYFSVKEQKKPVKRLAKRKTVNGKEILYAVKVVGYSGDFRSEHKSEAEKLLVPGAKAVCYVIYYALEKGTVLNFNAEKEIKARQKLINSSFNDIYVESENKYVDALFSHSVLRGTESIFDCDRGLLHSPGGGNFYAAVWANDQCEYANPFFPFVGNARANAQAINCYKLFSEYVLRGECAPASIIAGGTKPLTIAGDRGDTEMFLSGLSRFLIAYGDKQSAEEFYPAAKAAADFILSKKTSDFLITSDSDELENRFPCGSINLSTNCLAYDALSFFVRLSNALNKDTEPYATASLNLKNAIIKYFSASVSGYEVYRYSASEKNLRSWISYPSVVGIDARKDEVYKALFSDVMYNNGTMKTSSASKTVWDRSLLFALRGAFLSDENKAFDYLADYAKTRLIGTHSPYPYEAFPEGNRAHLSAESVLYARIITEGIFGFKPASFTELEINPKRNCALYGAYYAGTKFDIIVKDGIKIKIGSKTYESDTGGIFDFSSFVWK